MYEVHLEGNTLYKEKEYELATEKWLVALRIYKNDDPNSEDMENKVVKRLVSVGYNAYKRMTDKETKLDQVSQDIFKTNFGNYEQIKVIKNSALKRLKTYSSLSE